MNSEEFAKKLSLMKSGFNIEENPESSGSKNFSGVPISQPS